MKYSRKMKCSACSRSCTRAWKPSSPRGKYSDRVPAVGQGGAQTLVLVCHGPGQLPFRRLAAGDEEQHPAQQGKDQNRHDPGQLHGRVVPAVDDVDHRQNTQHREQHIDDLVVVAQGVGRIQQPGHLQHQGQSEQKQAAEHGIEKFFELDGAFTSVGEKGSGEVSVGVPAEESFIVPDADYHLGPV